MQEDHRTAAELAVADLVPSGYGVVDGEGHRWGVVECLRMLVIVFMEDTLPVVGLRLL